MNQFDIRYLLKSAYAERLCKNQKYSLRSFARDLGLSAGFLSKLLNGTKGLSVEKARIITNKLGLSASEKAIVLKSVESQFGRSKLIRLQAQKTLAKMGQHFQNVDQDTFKIIQDWYHYPLLSLMDIHSETKDLDFFAKRLGISTIEVDLAIRRLLSIQMLVETKTGYAATGNFFTNSNGVPSSYIRNHHKQYLQKSIDAIDELEIELRDFSNLIMAFDCNRVPEARVLIKQFREVFEQKFGSEELKRDEVFSLNIQFYKLTKKVEQND